MIGPDYSGSHTIVVEVDSGISLELRFHATVLHMRGDQLTRQPFVSKDGDVFLWNGEVFGGLDVGQRCFALDRSSELMMP